MSFRFPPWPAALLLAFAATLFGVLYPRLGRMKVPVFIYSLVMLVMAAAGRLPIRPNQDPGSAHGRGRAVLFMLSDGVLAVNRFRKPFRSAQALILSAYFAAQGLIALSVCL